MKVVIIGAGVTGSATGRLCHKLGHEVRFCDIDTSINQKLEDDGKFATIHLSVACTDADIIFVCLNVPTQDNGELDFTTIQNVIPGIVDEINTAKKHVTVVFRSTMLPRSMEMIVKKMKQGIKVNNFAILYNPEFLREKYAIEDSMNPERVVIGTGDNIEDAFQLIQLYDPLGKPIFTCKYVEAELIKYAANSFLALKISYFNEIGTICDKLVIRKELVSKLIGMDKRIGTYGTESGRPFQGFCLPKDTKAFVRFLKNLNVEMDLLQPAIDINEMFGEVIADHYS